MTIILDAYLYSNYSVRVWILVGGNGGDIGDIRGGEAINRISCMGSNLLDADNEDECANVLAN